MRGVSKHIIVKPLGYATVYVTVYGPPAGGEEVGAKAENPNPLRSGTRPSICLEQDKDGRPGCSP